MEWNNIKEKLPDSPGPFVCWINKGHDEFGIYQGCYRTARFVNGRFYSRGEDITYDVLLWLQLSTRPETEKDNA